MSSQDLTKKGYWLLVDNSENIDRWLGVFKVSKRKPEGDQYCHFFFADFQCNSSLILVFLLLMLFANDQHGKKIPSEIK